MSNVPQLFWKKKNENPSNLDIGAGIAVADFLASSAHLGCTLKELSIHLDAMDHMIDTIGDTETRNLHRQSMTISREKLTSATLELSRMITMLANFFLEK